MICADHSLQDSVDPNSMAVRNLLILATNDMVDNADQRSDDFLEGVLHAKRQGIVEKDANPPEFLES